jgi:hypothetical protein
MKLYKYNFFTDYQTQSGETFAFSAYDVEKQIKAAFPLSTNIYIWSV